MIELHLRKAGINESMPIKVVSMEDQPNFCNATVLFNQFSHSVSGLGGNWRILGTTRPGYLVDDLAKARGE